MSCISRQIAQSMERSSWIRKMFEEGARRTAIYGADKVFDFSIGNPVFEPPPEVKQALAQLIAADQPGMHRYMPNPGYPATRAYVAGKLAEETGLAFTQDQIIMVVGAGGGLNVVLKALLDPGDEVIVLCPYFVEYDAYIGNHGGKVVRVETKPDFSLDLAALAQAIGPATKAVIINSPNNPTGVIYPAADLAALGRLLAQQSQALGRAITLISDEPYKHISYGQEVPSVFNHYDHSVVVTSSSKDLALPGERIGHLAVSPRHQDAKNLVSGAIIALRILGFVNAPALMQRMLPLVGDARVDVAPYQKNRDLLWDHLTSLGFECVKPGGAFYLFPKSPLADDLAFVAKAQEHNLLLVPGTAFGRPGHFRIAYCFETSMIERSLPVFTKLAQELF